MIEASNFKSYFLPSDVDKICKLSDDPIFDLRPLFVRDSETSCVLDLSDIFTEKTEIEELKFFENHFPKEEVHCSKITES